jgi:hypothetical protein
VLLKSSRTRREVSIQYVHRYPAYRRGKHGKIETRWAPYFRPGYPLRWVSEITVIDAEMIVFEK